MNLFDGLPALISVPKAAELLGLRRAQRLPIRRRRRPPTRHLGDRVFVVTSQLEAFVNGDGEAA